MNTETNIGQHHKHDPLNDGISSVQYVDHMGSDLSVVNAARVSMDKESTWEFDDTGSFTSKHLSAGDVKLIDYLAAHNHWTPFGHAHLSLRIKAPIYVARQLVKHQIGLVWNEVSRRYVDTPPEIYIPDFVAGRADKVKQGSTGAAHEDSPAWVNAMSVLCRHAESTYNNMIKAGVAPEDARMILPLNMYTEWVWSGSLAAWARVANLRCDPHSQRHTRAYGEAISAVVSSAFPVSFTALTFGRDTP